MKRLRDDDEGLIPLLVGVGVAVAALFGGSYLLTGDDPVTAFIDFLKAVIIASLLFVFGVLALMQKFVVIPRPYGLIVGIGCVAGSIWLLWRGF